MWCKAPDRWCECACPAAHTVRPPAMMVPSTTPPCAADRRRAGDSRAMPLLLLVTVFVCTLALRIWGVGEQFWLLRDQSRDWAIALGTVSGSASRRPLDARGWRQRSVRRSTGFSGRFASSSVRGSTTCRMPVASGSPHCCRWPTVRCSRPSGGAPGHVWLGLGRRCSSATAGYDLCFASVVWNPMMARRWPRSRSRLSSPVVSGPGLAGDGHGRRRLDGGPGPQWRRIRRDGACARCWCSNRCGGATGRRRGALSSPPRRRSLLLQVPLRDLPGAASLQ